MVDVTEPPVVRQRRDFRLVRTQRVLQIVLGLFWLLDAGLQFQPFMFSSNFTTTYLLNNAQNQPDVIRWIITNVGNFVGPHVAVWNTFFALIQVAIGLGLLFRRTVRPALAVSFFWAFGVWFFGEGLGLIFTGSASALTGAPGSVFLYGLIGLMAWPRSAPTEEGDETEPSVGLASSAAGQGIGGAMTPSLVWCGYWSLAADPVPPPRQPDPDVGVECDHGHVVGGAECLLPLSQQLWHPFRQRRGVDHLAPGHRIPRHRVRTPRVPPTDSVPGRWRIVGGVLLGERPGSRRHLYGLGNRPQYRPADRAPGAGHGAGRAAGYDVLAVPVLDRALSISRVGAGEPGGSASGALPQRRLPGGRPGVDQHGHGRHDRHVRGDIGFGGRDVRRPPAVLEGTTERRGPGWTSRTHPTWSWLGRAPA